MLGIMNSVIRTATLSDTSRSRQTQPGSRTGDIRPERRVRRALRRAGLT